MPTAKRAKKTTPKPKAAPKRPNRRLALYDLAAFSLGRRGSRDGNPYGKEEVRAAIRIFGDPSGFDLPERYAAR